MKSKRGEVANLGDAILTEIAERLVRVYHPERIYLFGSMARGDAGPDSDYDILLIVDDETAPENFNLRRAYDALWGIRTSADIHIWSRKRFDSRLHLKASLPATIMREGKLLYAA